MRQREELCNGADTVAPPPVSDAVSAPSLASRLGTERRLEEACAPPPADDSGSLDALDAPAWVALLRGAPGGVGTTPPSAWTARQWRSAPAAAPPRTAPPLSPLLSPQSLLCDAQPRRVPSDAAVAAAAASHDGGSLSALLAPYRDPHAGAAPGALLRSVLVHGCACERWEAVVEALALGAAPCGDASPPQLVPALLRQPSLCALRALLAATSGLGREEAGACLAAALRLATRADGASPQALAAAAPLRAAAAAALRAAEGAVSRAPRSGAGGSSRALHPPPPSAALEEARLRVAVVDCFTPGGAALLPSLLACRVDEGRASAALASLPPDAAATLLRLLLTWMRLFRSRLAPHCAHSVAGVPRLAHVVSWATLALDAHFAAIAMSPAARPVAKQLAAAVKSHRAAAQRLATLEGAVAHLALRKALPAPAGTVSASYMCELWAA